MRRSPVAPQSALKACSATGIAPVVTFGDCLRIEADFCIESGLLPADYDPSWSRDRS